MPLYISTPAAPPLFLGREFFVSPLESGLTFDFNQSSPIPELSHGITSMFRAWQTWRSLLPFHIPRKIGAVADEKDEGGVETEKLDEALKAAPQVIERMLQA